MWLAKIVRSGWPSQRDHIFDLFFFPELFFLRCLLQLVIGTLLSKTKAIWGNKMESAQSTCHSCHTRGPCRKWHHPFDSQFFSSVKWKSTYTKQYCKTKLGWCMQRIHSHKCLMHTGDFYYYNLKGHSHWLTLSPILLAVNIFQPEL